MKKFTTSRGNKSTAVRQVLRSLALMNAKMRDAQNNVVENKPDKVLIAEEYVHLLEGKLYVKRPQHVAP